MNTLFVKYEAPTVRAFFPHDKRERYVQLLGKSNRRHDALKTMHHEIVFDPAWSTTVEMNADVAAILKDKGAGPKAYLIGTSGDGSILPLDDAVACLEKEAGMLVSIAGKLAYYYGGPGKRRLILERRNPPHEPV
jgi:hypothetical protein